jgi:hypothetical protein
MFVEQIPLGSQWLRRRRAESRGMALIRPRSGASPAGCEVAVAACCRHHLQRMRLLGRDSTASVFTTPGTPSPVVGAETGLRCGR